MRILVISNLYPPDVVGGWELGCRQMTEALRSRGHEVRVLTSTPRLPTISLPDGERRVLRVEELWDDDLRRSDARAANVRAALIDSHNIELLGQEFGEFEPDVVYLWNLMGLGAAALALAVELSGVAWTAHLMDSLPLHIAGAIGAGRRDLAAQLSRRLVGTWIVCSNGLLDEIEFRRRDTAGRGRGGAQLDRRPSTRATCRLVHRRAGPSLRLSRAVDRGKGDRHSHRHVRPAP